MVKKKGDVRHSNETKTLMISLINDYKLFNATDAEMMRLISQKLGKSISYTLFRELKKESNKREIIATEWLDQFCKGKIIDHYWTLIKGLNLAHRYLLELVVKEMSKEKPNAYLVNNLLKTLGDISTRLSELGMSPPTVAKLYSLIPQEILTGTVSKDPIELQKYLKMFDDNLKEDREKANIPQLVDSNIESENNEQQQQPNDDEGSRETNNNDDGDNNEIDPLSRQTALPPPIHKEDDNRSNGGAQGTSGDPEDEQRVF